LEERTLDYSVEVVRFCAQIKDPDLRSLKNQLIRSATSIGANYAEANNAASKADFRNKVFIAKKEAAETEYWLKILLRLDEQNLEAKRLLQETHELLLILQKIINTTSQI
jgi:four helix bundle protein